MRVLAIVVLFGALAGTANADTAGDYLARARQLYGSGDFPRARDAFLAAYQLDARAEILFDLGQTEFNMRHFAAAIAYYEQFLATSPTADQTAMTQQAIGAARTELARSSALPPQVTAVPRRLPPHREWDIDAWGLTALGGLAVVVGSGLVYDAVRDQHEAGGTLRQFDQRLRQDRAQRLGGLVCASAGVLAIGAAVVRWRFHLVDTAVKLEASPQSAALVLEHVE